MNIKQQTYSLVREISSILISDGLYAYEDKINGKIADIGICDEKEFNRDLDYNERRNYSKFTLWKKEVREVHRSNLFGRIDFKPYLISNPYEYLQDNNLEEVELLRFDYASHSIFDLNDKKLPRAQHFDYIEAQIHDGCYNLKLILELLEKRNDIQFLTKGIVPIPYYNQDDQQQNYIEFIWIPSDEDFKKVFQHSFSWDITKKIKELIFGFPEPRNLYE